MRTFLILGVLVAVVLVGVAIAIEFASLDSATALQLGNVRALVRDVGVAAWTFARPLLQLVVVFLILEWLFSRIGVSLRLAEIQSNWNVQTFIAGMIVTTFCIAVLADIQAVGYLKDVVLIVIGFYFGTRARTDSSAFEGRGKRYADNNPSSPLNVPDNSRSTPGYEDVNPFDGRP